MLPPNPTGAGLRPRASAGRGLALGAAVYMLVGVAWVIGFNVSLGSDIGTILRELPTPAGLAIVLMWPLQMAQALGLFGLRFN